MKKLVYFLSLYIALGLASCKKEDDTVIDPNPPYTNPYYFRFSLAGTAYNFAQEQPQYLSSSEYGVGGFQNGNGLFPSILLAFYYSHPVTDADVRALAGQTIYFNDTSRNPELQFDQDASSISFSSIDTASTAYSVKVNSVSFIKVDTTIFNIVDVYELRGKCNAVLSNGTEYRDLTDGEFTLLVSRVKQ